MAKSLLQLSVLSMLAASSFISGTVLAAPSYTTPKAEESWPYGPLVTKGRNITNTQGQNVVYAGANWPGAADVMIPEGLQYQSIESIVSKIKSLGMNAIRLTYAIELVDQIYDNGGEDISIQTAFTNALGQANGSAVFEEVVANNPAFSANTTRLQVYDAIATECAAQQVFVHLDNHMSKGAWCCDTADGNAWFGDTYFNVANWTRGLSYMANHGKSWTSLTSMSLRNELRTPDDNSTLAESSYNWQDWYKYIKEGTAAINSANKDVLIFLSGLSFDTFMTPIVQGTALTPGSGKYDAADFAGYTDKLVVELHNYANSATNCSDLQESLYTDGFQAMHPEDEGAVNVFPVALTEFGFQQDASTWESVYATCIASYLADQKASWFIWVLAGSYYIRSGTQNYDETWGLLSHDWSTWRSTEYVDGGLKPLINSTASPE
ncbi:glycoside hydrolase superfamily [Xylariales sp. AK1849]|nr:glycoside hydrolase superfamily [Xylariales sp. AK1849]